MLAANTSPITNGSFSAATLWVQGLLLGSVGTAVAVIAIATCGMLMLTGRVDLRRGATVIVGCFVLFGAATIAAGVQSLATGSEVRRLDDASPIAVASPVAPVAPPPPVPAMSDPYAGAAVPRNR